MSDSLKQQIVDALAHLPVPDGGQDAVARGLVSDIFIADGKAFFSLSVPAAEAQAFEPFRQAAETAAANVPGISSAMVALTAERTAGSMRNAPPPPRAAPAKPSITAPRSSGGKPGIPGVTHIVAVASGKGGVGKSTTAVNFALGLKAMGLKVGLLDADIYGPSVPRLLGLKGRPETIDGKRLKPMEAYGLKAMSIGFLIEPESAMIWRGPMVQSAITQMLRDVAWGELDVLVVDMPPGTGDAQLTMAQATPLSGAVIVSTPQDLALIDARRGVTMFRKVSVPILGVIENMATFICPNCGAASAIFGHGGARQEAQRLEVPFLGEIPLTMAIRETSDAGRPVVATDPDGPQAKVYREIAQKLWGNLTGTPAGRAAPRIVIE